MFLSNWVSNFSYKHQEVIELPDFGNLAVLVTKINFILNFSFLRTKYEIAVMGRNVFGEVKKN